MDSTFKSSEEIEKDADMLHKNQNKRKNKKNLREKRRSTGVILMPCVDSDEYDRTAQENTIYNEDNHGEFVSSSVYSETSTPDIGSIETSELISQLQEYQNAIEEWQNAYSRLETDLESLKENNEKLKLENQKLKGEYDALMKVVKMMNK